MEKMLIELEAKINQELKKKLLLQNICTISAIFMLLLIAIFFFTK